MRDAPGTRALPLASGSRQPLSTLSRWLFLVPSALVSTSLTPRRAAASLVCLDYMMQRNVPQLTPQPVTFKDGEIVYPQFAYPLRNEIVPIWAAALLAFFVPFVVFLICSIRVRSFWDINNATIGLLYSLIVAAVFQVFIKWLIGGMFCPLERGSVRPCTALN
jgi:hypothetical protein